MNRRFRIGVTCLALIATACADSGNPGPGARPVSDPPASAFSPGPTPSPSEPPFEWALPGRGNAPTPGRRGCLTPEPGLVAKLERSLDPGLSLTDLRAHWSREYEGPFFFVSGQVEGPKEVVDALRKLDDPFNHDRHVVATWAANDLDGQAEVLTTWGVAEAISSLPTTPALAKKSTWNASGRIHAEDCSDPGHGGADHSIRKTVRDRVYGVSEVTYVVDVASSASTITYQNENGNASQATDVALPWEYSFRIDFIDFLYVSAQNAGGGEIRCTILIDGVVWERSSSTGPYAICEAST
jgi:hypothetical protein